MLLEVFKLEGLLKLIDTAALLKFLNLIFKEFEIFTQVVLNGLLRHLVLIRAVDNEAETGCCVSD